MGRSLHCTYDCRHYCSIRLGALHPATLLYSYCRDDAFRPGGVLAHRAHRLADITLASAFIAAQVIGDRAPRQVAVPAHGPGSRGPCLPAGATRQAPWYPMPSWMYGVAKGIEAGLVLAGFSSLARIVQRAGAGPSRYRSVPASCSTVV
jgi:hypothetical protein